MSKRITLTNVDVDTADESVLLSLIPRRVDRRLLRNLDDRELTALEACVQIEYGAWQDYSDAKVVSDKLDRVQDEQARRKHLRAITGCVEQVYKIECTMCSEIDEWSGDDPAEAFYKAGWREYVTEDEIGLGCPECISERNESADTGRGSESAMEAE